MYIPIAIVGHATSMRTLQAFCDASAHVSECMLRERAYPLLYASGIYYRNERRGPPVPGVERFQTAESLYDVGAGDCDDLACVRSAELRVHRGERARPMVVRMRDGLYHVVVRREDGRIEDPSRILGM